jgi:hypothetical protein
VGQKFGKALERWSIPAINNSFEPIMKTTLGGGTDGGMTMVWAEISSVYGLNLSKWEAFPFLKSRLGGH